MHKYFIKSPWWIKKIFPSYIWSLPAKKKELYLTFDDGPNPEITRWVLGELKKYNALATFFCIGENVKKYPEVYQQILNEGHTTGNHTQTHLNGWQVTTEQYIKDVSEAAKYIRTNLFRPPYGRIKSSQAACIPQAIEDNNAKIIMWDVLSADFDTSFTPEQCLRNVIQFTSPGSIIVFHDSNKAFKNLVYTLPRVMQHFSEKGCLFKKIDL